MRKQTTKNNMQKESTREMTWTKHAINFCSLITPKGHTWHRGIKKWFDIGNRHQKRPYHIKDRFLSLTLALARTVRWSRSLLSLSLAIFCAHTKHFRQRAKPGIPYTYSSVSIYGLWLSCIAPRKEKGFVPPPHLFPSEKRARGRKSPFGTMGQGHWAGETGGKGAKIEAQGHRCLLPSSGSVSFLSPVTAQP